MKLRKFRAALLLFLMMGLFAVSALAAPEVLYMKEGDLQPYYYAAIVDSDEDPVDLTGASVYFTMKDASGSVKVSLQAATVTDASNGYVEYRWQSGDTATAGRYYVEFKVVPLSGGPYRVPADPRARAVVIITEPLD
jgi:hypothetical protein